MSTSNPYQSQTIVEHDDGIRKVSINPFELFRRSYDLLGSQYWLFLGITFVGILIGSAVPMAILLGPMMVGIYLCFMEKEQGRQVEFGKLFDGFQYFVESLLATLVMIAVSFVVMIPAVIIFMVLIIVPAAIAENNGGNGEPSILLILMMYPIIFLLSFICYIPFLFVYQLIADRQLKAMDAVRMSLRGALRNLGGVIWFMLVLGFLSVILALMCYIPAILFMPISMGALFLLYRDIYGSIPLANEVAPAAYSPTEYP